MSDFGERPDLMRLGCTILVFVKAASTCLWGTALTSCCAFLPLIIRFIVDVNNYFRERKNKFKQVNKQLKSAVPKL